MHHALFRVSTIWNLSRWVGGMGYTQRTEVSNGTTVTVWNLYGPFPSSRAEPDAGAGTRS